MPRYAFHRLRQSVPSILNDCPSLRVVNSNYADGFFAEFPADDSAMAPEGQALAKLNDFILFGIFTLCGSLNAFANASSPVNFIVLIWRPPSSVDHNLAFDLANEVTREQLTFKRIGTIRRFLLIRCPIVRDTNKWAKWEKEAIDWQFNGQWNRIDI